MHFLIRFELSFVPLFSTYVVDAMILVARWLVPFFTILRLAHTNCTLIQSHGLGHVEFTTAEALSHRAQETCNSRGIFLVLTGGLLLTSNISEILVRPVFSPRLSSEKLVVKRLCMTFTVIKTDDKLFVGKICAKFLSFIATAGQ